MQREVFELVLKTIADAMKNSTFSDDARHLFADLRALPIGRMVNGLKGNSAIRRKHAQKTLPARAFCFCWPRWLGFLIQLRQTLFEKKRILL